MRKLRCYQVSGLCVKEVLDEFNERRERQDEGFDIPDADILSVSAVPSTSRALKAMPDGSLEKPNIDVVIVYWSNN